MKNPASDIIKVTSISQYNQYVGLPKPQHPLVSLVKFEDLPAFPMDATVKFILDFYTVTLKKDCHCKAKYGQTHYDFDEGVMSFISPQQTLGVEEDYNPPTEGWMLMFHTDFIRNYPLGQRIKEYGFFYYSMNEALMLSEKEEASIEALFHTIDDEYHLPIDTFSQDVMIAQLELLLTYCNRYYSRQFVTRKTPNSNLLAKVEILLTDYFDHKTEHKALLTVTYLAEQLHMSAKYLSDTLRSLTGQSAQQHIQNKLIEKAKQKLSTTDLSVSEIAYELGFDYSQSFSKLFKKKTNLSPLAFRQSFN